MKDFLLVALMLLLAFVTKAQDIKKPSIRKTSAHSLIGIIYNNANEINEFKGYKKMAGGLLNYNSIKSQKVEYALDQMYKPGKLILILSKANEDTTKGRWVLLDTVSVKHNVYNGGKYTLVTEGCSINNRRDNWVFAILPYYQYKKVLRNPLRVFKVDKINDKIIELRNRKGIFCINNAYGDID